MDPFQNTHHFFAAKRTLEHRLPDVLKSGIGAFLHLLLHR